MTTRAANLRALAEAKRQMAAIARQVGPVLSLAADRQMMREQERELLADAIHLDAAAAALEAEQPVPRNGSFSEDRKTGAGGGRWEL
jgi:hypothetical protein